MRYGADISLNEMFSIKRKKKKKNKGRVLPINEYIDLFIDGRDHNAMRFNPCRFSSRKSRKSISNSIFSEHGTSKHCPALILRSSRINLTISIILTATLRTYLRVLVLFVACISNTRVFFIRGEKGRSFLRKSTCRTNIKEINKRKKKKRNGKKIDGENSKKKKKEKSKNKKKRKKKQTDTYQRKREFASLRNLRANERIRES